MSLFGRSQEPSSSTTRSAEERERARLEREARRAAREGRPAPQPAPPLDEPSWEPVAEMVPEEPPAYEEPPVPDEPPAFEEPAVPEEPAYEEPAPEPEQEPVAEEHPTWFADDEPVAEEPVAEPPTAAASQIDTPTVEWDVMAEEPRPAVAEPEPEPAVGHEADAEPSVRRITPVAAGATRSAPASPARPSVRAARFGDEEERPVPTRRVTPRTVAPRARTLPPPPPPPGEKQRRGRPGRRAFLLVLLLLVVLVAAWLVNALYQPFAGKGGDNVRVSVPSSSTAGDIGDLLEQRGVVDSSRFFALRARMDGGSLKAGDYTLRKDMPYGDAIKALSAGPPPPKTIRVTVPEGRARREAAPLIRQAGITGSYLQASERSRGFSPRRYGAPRSLQSLEGFLFPATYELEPGASSRDLVAKQLEAFEENFGKVNMRRARARNLDGYDVLTIASMVERESTLDRERRLVAAVIHNRLRQGMPLGIDATIRFATRNWSSPLKESELAIDSPYNTRRRTGLPPGPIGSPGLASMQAAADPADVDYLFYVVKPCGKGAHNFSATDAEFQRDVAAYNRKREELGGQSPVDC